MRVLSIGSMYPPHHLGGYELMWRSAVAHLRAAGDEVRVLASDLRIDDPDPGIPEDDDIRRELRWYWRDHGFPRFSMRERLRLERHNARVLERELRDFRPDVVSWWAMGGMSLSLIEAVRRRGLPAVGAVHDDWLVYGPLTDAWLRGMSRLGSLRALVEHATGIPARVELDRAARWLFVSEVVWRNARASGLELRESGIAHSGVDLSLFRPRPQQPWSGRLLWVGRLDPRKGAQVAVQALTRLSAARLRIVGGGDERHRAELRELAVAVGVDDRVSFERCARDQLPAIYADADALLFPVLWEEPWGLVPLEAMAVGAPVVATGTGGSSEYLQDGENCLIYSPRDDPNALAAAVARLAADESLRARLRTAGFETASRYTQAKFNDAVESALAHATRAGENALAEAVRSSA